MNSRPRTFSRISLLKRSSDGKFFADRLSKLNQTGYEFVVFKFLELFERLEEIFEAIESNVDFFNRRFGVIVLKCAERGGLRTVKQHERTVLFVR